MMNEEKSYLTDPRSQESQDLAFFAERAAKVGRIEEARAQFAKAAELESQVAREVPKDRPRTRGLLAISATSLFGMAGEYRRASQEAHYFLQDDSVADEFRETLADLIEQYRREEAVMEEYGSSAVPAILEVAIDGGSVRKGSAPHGVVATTAANASELLNLSWRFLSQQQCRSEGVEDLPTEEGKTTTGFPSRTWWADHYELREAPAIPGSMRMRFLLLMKKGQLSLPGLGPSPDEIIEFALKLARAGGKSGRELAKLLPSEDDQRAVLDLLRRSAPDQTRWASVRYSTPTWRIRAAPVELLADARATIREALVQALPRKERVQYRGELVSISLGKAGPSVVIKERGETHRRHTVRLETFPLDQALPLLGKRVEVLGRLHFTGKKRPDTTLISMDELRTDEAGTPGTASDSPPQDGPSLAPPKTRRSTKARQSPAASTHGRH